MQTLSNYDTKLAGELARLRTEPIAQNALTEAKIGVLATLRACLASDGFDWDRQTAALALFEESGDPRIIWRIRPLSWAVDTYMNGDPNKIATLDIGLIYAAKAYDVLYWLVNRQIPAARDDDHWIVLTYIHAGYWWDMYERLRARMAEAA